MSDIAAIIAPVRGRFSLAEVASAAALHPTYVSDLLAGRRKATAATLSRLRLAVARLKARQGAGALDASVTYRATLALAALALGLDPAVVAASDPARKATKNAAWCDAAQARKLALYIMNTGLGLQQTAVARAAGVTKQVVSLAARDIEEARDAGELGPVVERLEQWILGEAA